MTSTPEAGAERGAAALGTPRRLDAYLVAAGLARSRGAAQDLIRLGRVRVDGAVVSKPAYQVALGAEVEAEGQQLWVGRGARKLLAALDDFDITVAGTRCLDIGASTGGFTQVLLRADAAHVVALDVGHGQLVAELAADPRVTDRSGTNIREVEPGSLGDPFDVVVADLSFISLTHIFPVVPLLLAPQAQLVLLIKPQFEVGRGRLGKSGVVRSAQLRHEAVHSVVGEAVAHGLTLRGLARSPLAGSGGNIEYLGWFTAQPPDRFEGEPEALTGTTLAERIARLDDDTAGPDDDTSRPDDEPARLHDEPARLHDEPARLHDEIARLDDEEEAG